MKHRNLPLVYSPHYSIPWDPKHRFPMSKYRRLYELLVAEELAGKTNVHISSPCPRDILALAHHLPYIDRFIRGDLTPKEQKAMGLIWSEQLVRRTLTAVGGTLLTCRLAREAGVSCHLAGGTHHAFADRGQGFCVFNDIAVAARYLVERCGLRHVLILDCDVHQGDGTAAILADEPRCFTCSLHGARNYPFDKQCSDLDVPLPCDTGDEEYMAALNQTLTTLERLPRPDLIIYDGGSDVHRDDRLGRLSLTETGMAARDRRVLQWAHDQGAPIACLIGGGYDHDHQRLAERHAILVRTAHRFYRERVAVP